MGTLNSRHPEHDQVADDHQGVKAVAVLAQPRVVDPGEHQRDQHTDAGIDRLALDVVAPGSSPPEREQRARNQSERSQRKHGIGERHHPRARRGLLFGALDRHHVHSVCELPAM